ncbi:MAG: FAD-dependent oxidoreductase [Actinomycetota bacterium]
MHTHDLIVIGAGMAGINATIRAAEAGRRVALVERAMVGGTCPTRGCIPTKAMVRSAEIAHEARRAGEFGIRVTGVEVDFAAVIDRVRGIIDKGSRGARGYLESLDAVELIDGEARLTGPESVRVDGREISAARIVVATGAEPSIPPIPGLADVPHLTSDDVLRLTDLPRRIVVIGGGPIALELGQALSRLGAAVTLVEVLPRLLPAEEPEIVDMLAGYLREEGIEVLTGATVRAARPGPALLVEHGGRERLIEADALLVATGRRPATAALGLAEAGVELDRAGIRVDERLRTTRGSVFAAGDVVGLPYGAFTHVARRMGVAVAENALDLAPQAVEPDLGPRAVFTDPELAMIGMTEAEARAAGHDVAVGTATPSGGKARAWGEERGMVKVVIDARTRRILGARILAYHGADLVHPVAVAMSAPGGAVDPLLATMHVHPTLGEVVLAAAQRAAA